MSLLIFIRLVRLLFKPRQTVGGLRGSRISSIPKGALTEARIGEEVLLKRIGLNGEKSHLSSQENGSS